MKILKKALPYLAASALPLTVLAATTLTDVLKTSDDVLRRVIPVLLLVGTIVFLWGVITYLTAGEDEGKKSYGKWLIIYGLIGLFAMVAIWGIVRILAATFDVETEGIPLGPGFKRP